MKKVAFYLFTIIVPIALEALTTTIKDITKISTQRENYLIGYGVVIGLPQTGDTKILLAKESLDNILKSSGIESSGNKLVSKNTAAVMVMAKLPPVSRSGDRIDIWISSIGDAKSLSGGFLLQTPLQGQDGDIYAVAQSQIPVKKTEERVVRTDMTTTIFISEGATVEKGVSQPFYSPDNKFKMVLRNFDITNLNAVKKAVEKKYPNSVYVSSTGLIEISIPENQQMEFISSILNMPIEVKSDNKVVIDSQSGTIVMGNDVKISKIGITKNGISIKIKGNSAENIQKVSNGILDEASSVEDLVKGLNSLGLSAGEIIDILKTIHAAGALHGDLILL